jgi:CheY-like chemotaxis protein
MTKTHPRPAAVVVEDDPMNRHLFREILEMQGFCAVCAADGRNIENVVEAAAAALVLMDIRLPGESGLSLMRRLRAHRPTAGLPIHAVTAYAEVVPPTMVSPTGFSSIISKPIHLPALMRVLEGARTHWRAAGPGPPLDTGPLSGEVGGPARASGPLL